LKKRLYEKKNLKKEIIILLLSFSLVYLMFSFDLFFCDILCLTPGLVLSLIYLMKQKAYLSYILSTYYAVIWILGFREYYYFAPFIFMFLIAVSYIVKKRVSITNKLFFIVYVIEYLFSSYLFNNFFLISSQLIQFVFYLLVFFHIRKKSLF
jgi:hypothetical protein